MASDLLLETYVDERGTTLFVAGEVDLHTGAQLRSEVFRVIDTGAMGILVDASSVSFVDSTGLGVLVGARKAASAAGVAFQLRPSDRMRHLLTRTGLLQFFDVAS
jgi:anti-sigma B factor antagonist